MTDADIEGALFNRDFVLAEFEVEDGIDYGLVHTDIAEQAPYLVER